MLWVVAFIVDLASALCVHFLLFKRAKAPLRALARAFRDLPELGSRVLGSASHERMTCTGKVEVAPNAAPMGGPISGQPCAFISLEIEEEGGEDAFETKATITETVRFGLRSGDVFVELAGASDALLLQAASSHESGPVAEVPTALREFLERHGRGPIAERGDGFMRRHNYVENSLRVGAELSVIGSPVEPAALTTAELDPTGTGGYRTAALTTPRGVFTAALHVELGEIYRYSRQEIARAAQSTWSFELQDLRTLVPIFFGTTLALGAVFTVGSYLAVLLRR